MARPTRPVLSFALAFVAACSGDGTGAGTDSATETDEIIGALFENTSWHLQRSLEAISKEGKGLLLYMRPSDNKDAVLQKLRRYKSLSENGEGNPRALLRRTRTR